MNALLKILPLTGLLAFNFVVEANSAVKQKNNKIDVKCYVELIGGTKTITFWNISSKKLLGLSNAIVGRKVMVVNSKKKVNIFKSHECVLLEDDFTSSNAKLLDAETAR